MKTKLICLLIALSSATTMWAERIWFGNLCYETTSDSTVCVTYQRRLYYGTENNYNKLTSVTIPSSIHDSGLFIQTKEIIIFIFPEHLPWTDSVTLSVTLLLQFS